MADSGFNIIYLMQSPIFTYLTEVVKSVVSFLITGFIAYKVLDRLKFRRDSKKTLIIQLLANAYSLVPKLDDSDEVTQKFYEALNSVPVVFNDSKEIRKHSKIFRQIMRSQEGELKTQELVKFLQLLARNAGFTLSEDEILHQFHPKPKKEKRKLAGEGGEE